ncbi:MAG TPA: hypothetical protein PL017_13120 [Tenuifilaceae bacterium]|nr:hypothetical protein [Tenuifilaceae bacterium]HPE19458.1 hypothetical protein [Tenuifilaceae bacterium]HPJ47032.1 hypothetical protein [Tenuifilaceae bacterium]HPQ35547.1 hypothetical protein [Tenuifilaceae bacterium]HRX69274.1 hypothetical protein [Tenuifilaceae bacterium]
MKLSRVIVLAFLTMLAFSCKEVKKEGCFTPTKQQRAEDAIKNWMLKSNDHPHYAPVVFGDVTPRFEQTNRSFQLSMLIAEEESLNPDGSAKLDSLKMLQNENPGNLLGYIVLHKYTTKNIAGETISNENLFFLDTAFRVASVLNPESFDMILNEKTFYRLDSVE